MSDIRFACPYCSQHIACDAGYADLAIDCPACGNSMVVPRLTAADSTQPRMVLVASTVTPKHIPSVPVQISRAWTEREWAQHMTEIEGVPWQDANAPWILAFFATLIIALILKVNGISGWVMTVWLIFGGGLAGVLVGKAFGFRKGYSMVNGLIVALGFAFLVPVVLGSIFSGCCALN
jgi:hypothetical protein